jgi:hypothetical protein
MIVFPMHMPALEAVFLLKPEMRLKPMLLYNWIASGWLCGGHGTGQVRDRDAAGSWPGWETGLGLSTLLP